MKPEKRFVRVAIAVPFLVLAGVLAVAAAVRVNESSQRVLALLAGGALASTLLAVAALRRHRLKGLGEVMGVLGGITGAMALVLAVSPVPTTRILGSPLCEAANSEGIDFAAETEGLGYAAITEFNEGRGVTIRAKPEVSTDYDVVGRLLPALCLVGFEGFCIGEAVAELSDPKGPLDQLWFALPENKGFVSAGVVQELAPGAIGSAPMASCDEERYPEPTTIELTHAPDSIVENGNLQFEAPNAITVGAAAYYRDARGIADWYQVGIDQDATDGFRIGWDTRGIPRQVGVDVVYAVCWAGFVPGRAAGATSVDLVRESGGNARAAPTPTPERFGHAIACASSGGT